MTFAELYNQDCLDKLKEIESESVDLIFADPPTFQLLHQYSFLSRANYMPNS